MLAWYCFLSEEGSLGDSFRGVLGFSVLLPLRGGGFHLGFRVWGLGFGEFLIKSFLSEEGSLQGNFWGSF